MTLPHRNPSMQAAEMRAAQMAIAQVPGLRTIMNDAMAALTLSAEVLDAWGAADAPTRALVRRYAPALGAKLDALEAGPTR
jgi:hypothetical protein